MVDKNKDKPQRESKNNYQNQITAKLIETFNQLEIDGYLIRCVYFMLRSLLGVMLPAFILFPTHNNYYSSIQKNLSQFYFHYFSALSNEQGLMIWGGCFLLFIIEKISFYKNKIKVTIILVMLISIFLPILNPIYIQLILKPIGENNKLDYLLKGLTILNMLLIFLDGVCFDVFMFSFSMNSKNKLCKIKNNIISWREIIIIILSIVLPVLSNADRTIVIILQLAYFILPLATIYVLINSFIFYDPFTRKIHMLITCIEGSFLISCIFANIFEGTLFDGNLFQFAASTSIFSFYALCTYTSYKKESIYMEEASEIKKPSDGLIFLSLLNESLCSQTSEKELILINLKTAHKNRCSDPLCFCQKLKGDELCRKIVLEKIEELMENFEQDITVVLVSINLKLQLFEVYVDSFYDLLALWKKKQFSWSEKAALQSFKNQLSTYIQRKNKTLEIIKTEKVLQLQDRVEEIEETFVELLNKKSNFWKIICKRIINERQVEANFEFQMTTIKGIYSRMPKQIEAYGDNPQMIILFCYFYLCIELKNSLSSELKLKLKALEQKQFISFEKLISKSANNLLKLIFRNDSCTFESEVCEGKMGLIKNATKSVYQVFGVDSHKVIGNNIAELMPRSLRHQHGFMLQSWRKEGSWKNIGKLKEVFCINHRESCFSAHLYLKVFQNTDSLSIIASIFKKNQSDFIILNKKGIIEGIGSRFSKILGKICRIPLKLLSAEKIRLNSKDSFKTKKGIFYSVRDHIEEINEIKENYQRGVDSAKDEKQLKERFFEEAKRYEIQYQIHPQKLGSVRYTVLKMKEFEEFVFNSDMLQNGTSEGFIKYEPMQRPLKIQSDQRIPQNDHLMECANNSMTSTQKNEDFSLSKSLTQLQAIFLNSQLVQSQGISILIIIVFVCSFLMVLFLAIILDYNQRGLTEIKELFFADGACSNDMQLLEFMYNKGMNLKEYAGQEEFQSVINSAGYETLYVYGLIAAQMLHISDMTTKFTYTPYYTYHLQVSDWVLRSGKVIHITTTQFMAYLIYSQMKIMSYAGDQSKEEEILDLLETVKMNFPQLKKNNHKFLQLYFELFENNKHKMQALIWIKFAMHFLFSGFLFYCLHSYYLRKKVKKTQIYKLFSLISKKNAEDLKQYYHENYAYLKASIDKSRYEEKDQGLTLSRDRTKDLNKSQDYLWDLSLKNKFVPDFQKKPLQDFKFLDEKASRLKYVFLGLFLLLNSINAYLIIRNGEILDASEKMMININSLMDSQNYILQSYFDLKAEYIIKQSSKEKKEALVHELISKMNQNEVVFNKVATESIKIFENYDQDYSKDMTRLLVDNVCDLVKGQVPDDLVQKCQTQLSLRVMERGLVISMNFFQRNVLDAIYSDVAHTLIKEDFLSVQFKNIDFSIFFMFKIYQATQARIFISLDEALTSNSIFDYVFFSLQVFIYVLIIGFLRVFIKKEKKFISDLAGKILMVPLSVIKATNGLLKKIIDYFEFSQ